MDRWYETETDRYLDWNVSHLANAQESPGHDEAGD
jgi:hypothetical protein